MARPNHEVAALLQEYADLIAITGGEQFKARTRGHRARSADTPRTSPRTT